MNAQPAVILFVGPRDDWTDWAKRYCNVEGHHVFGAVDPTPEQLANADVIIVTNGFDVTMKKIPMEFRDHAMVCSDVDSSDHARRALSRYWWFFAEWFYKEIRPRMFLERAMSIRRKLEEEQPA